MTAYGRPIHCPTCKSQNINADNGIRTGRYLHTVATCKNCLTIWPIILDIPQEVANHQLPSRKP
jgi:uncharacterized Zn finger protein